MAPGMVPLLFAVAFAIFTVIYKTIGLPPPSEIAVIGKELYANYGNITLLIAAFLEGVFMINIYFPGSFVILLAVFLSDKTATQLSLIAFFCWLGFVGAGPLNYWLGNAGFYRVLLKIGKNDIVIKMRRWMDKRGKVAILLASIHPNFLAVAQVCMGISSEGYRKTLTLTALSLAMWVPLWTIIFSIVLKQVDMSDSNQAWYVVAIFIIWGIVLILKDNVYKPLKKRFNSD